MIGRLDFKIAASSLVGRFSRESKCPGRYDIATTIFHLEAFHFILMYTTFNCASRNNDDECH